PRGGVVRYARAGATMGIPLLHPWANRLDGFRYSVAGTAVGLDAGSGVLHLDERGLPIHGLLLGRSRFEGVREEATGVPPRLAPRLHFSPNPVLLAAFPFPHDLSLAITVRDDTLLIETTVTPTGDLPVPVAFGFHPYLTLPGAPRAEWWVELPVRERLLLAAHTLPTGGREPVTVAPAPLRDRAHAAPFVAPDHFVLAGGGRRLEVQFLHGYPFAQVFSPRGAAFICFEPMTAPGNALVRGGPDLRLIEPGDRFDAAFTLRVSRS